MKSLVATLIIIAAAVQSAHGQTVFLIATNHGLTAVGGASAFGRSNYLAGIEGDSVAQDNETAQLVSTNSTVTGPRISIGRTGGIPFTAFDGTNFLMVWEDDALAGTIGDIIYGQFISQSGVLVGSPFQISAGNTNASFHSVQPLAFGRKKYLVVWEDAPDQDTDYGDVHAALISPNGSVSGIINLTSGAITAATPAVAFGSTNGLVVWNNYRSGPTELWDIYGEFISTNGIPGSAFVVSQTPTPSFNPCTVDYDGTNFLVAWNKDIGPGYPNPTQWNIYGRLVSPAGVFQNNETVLVAGTNNPTIPHLVFDGANHLVSWSEAAPVAQAYFQFFDRSLGPIGPPFFLFPQIGSNTPLFGGGLFDGTRLMTIVTIGGYNSDGSFSAASAVYGRVIPASATPPALTALGGMPASHSLTLTLTGTPGVNYVLETSTSLAPASWTANSTNSPTNGTLEVTDVSATNAMRFYRAATQ